MYGFCFSVLVKENIFLVSFALYSPHQSQYISDESSWQFSVVDIPIDFCLVILEKNANNIIDGHKAHEVVLEN